jgi:uncharacterized protein
MDKEAAFIIANKYIEYLKKNKYDIVKSYLFGSYIKGNYNKDSDIDLAIVLNNLDNRFNTQVQLLMLTTKFDTRIEPHPIDVKDFNLSDPFVHEIVKNGVELD